jgi:hypothetical protein
MFLEGENAPDSESAVDEAAPVAACDAGIVAETPVTWDHARYEAPEPCRPGSLGNHTR